METVKVTRHPVLKRSVMLSAFAILGAATSATLAADKPVTQVSAATKPVPSPGDRDVQTSPATAAAPIRVTAWTWLIKIRDVNYPADELTVDMFVAFTYDLRFKDKINPMKHFEIGEAKSVTICEQDEESRPDRGEYYQSFRCIAVIGHPWDIRSFPFDRHTISISIEDSMDKAGTLFYVNAPDSGRDEVTIRDRELADYSVSVGEHKWGWGDTFSVYKIAFTLKPQHPWGMFQKLFLTVFIALTVALLSFFIDPNDINSRSGLLIGSLFAAVANQYVVGSSLPLAGMVTLVDTIHQLAYMVILLCLGLSVLVFKCAKNDRTALSRRIDNWGFRVLLAMYVTLVSAAFVASKPLTTTARGSRR
jgi:hypothetical protein